jgi:peptidoglycan/xylan/chitin deacetylase (PgdA/CDA1 family)
MNWSWLLPAVNGIPVLLYHKVWPGINDHLTITPERLREHWELLRKEGYQALSLDEYLQVATGQKPKPAKALLLTFDDGYRNNLTYVYPLLKEFGWKATFFVIANTLTGGYKEEGSTAEQKMTPAELRSLDPAIVQLALHGYSHRDMGSLRPAEMQEELAKSIQAFKDSGLPFNMVFAYPYGARPAGADLENLKELMQDMKITAAFRIGNKVSKVPAPDIFEIKRIDIKGTDTTKQLSIKLKKGKLKPF